MPAQANASVLIPSGVTARYPSARHVDRAVTQSKNLSAAVSKI